MTWLRLGITVAVLAASYAALNTSGLMTGREALWLFLAMAVPFALLAAMLYRAFRKRQDRSKEP